MWLKFLVGGLLVAFCTYLGYLAAEKYRKRRSFFSQFSAFNGAYLNELSYARKPLPDFIAAGDYSGEFKKTLERFSATQKAEADYAFLTPAEREEVREYFSMLGRGDSRAQLGFFRGREKGLAEKREVSAKEAKERGELCLKLGLLCGLAAVILII